MNKSKWHNYNITLNIISIYITMVKKINICRLLKDNKTNDKKYNDKWNSISIFLNIKYNCLFFNYNWFFMYWFYEWTFIEDIISEPPTLDLSILWMNRAGLYACTKSLVKISLKREHNKRSRNYQKDLSKLYIYLSFEILMNL